MALRSIRTQDSRARRGRHREPRGLTVIQGPPEPFCYARNVNLGIQACSGDVLLMNDDCRMVEQATLETLQGVFALRPDIGIVSPNVDGEANVGVCAGQPIQETKGYLSFICALIRREVFDKIGLLDEKYTGYGSEDVDFCRRAQGAGFTLAITSMATVSHKSSSSSYVREHALELKRAESARIYLEKWGRGSPGHYSDEI
jgi:GT2 family glycosyltransferase